MKRFFRNAAEFLVLFALWGLALQLLKWKSFGSPIPIVIVLILSLGKSVFFGVENLRELWDASLRNIPYYRFMLMMLVNMSQIITSFALDYHCLQLLDSESLGGMKETWTSTELLFECFYYSVLNFTFFGYGDVTPQTIPAKLLTMSEILLAFVTVIYLLSDFISLKESLLRQGTENVHSS